MKNLLNKKNIGVAVNSFRITFKLAIIFALILVLLIPQKMIKDLVRERETRQDQVSLAIAQQIGSSENIIGPILCIPYQEQIETIKIDEATKKTTTEIENYFSYAYFTAQQLNIDSKADVSNKYKDIYKVPFFQSENQISGEFTDISFAQWEKITENDILWEEAFLLIGVSDLKGISQSPTVAINNAQIDFEPGANGSDLFRSAIHAKLPASFAKQGGSFSITMPLRGTQAINFAATAKDNQMQMTSNWPHPNFESTRTTPSYKSGNVNRANTLPTSREIGDNGFTATWKENQFSIDQPEQWLQNAMKPDLQSRFMGTAFINIADEYDKTERSVKYMALIIALVFTTFFIIELLRETRVHPFQYVLVGSAIAIFFILLLAISEYTGFNPAYFIAATATTLLVGLYSLSVFHNKGMALSVTVLLAALFVFLFVILIAAQYSLLIGAVGLFLILTFIMYVTRNVKWYGLNQVNQES